MRRKTDVLGAAIGVWNGQCYAVTWGASRPAAAWPEAEEREDEMKYRKKPVVVEAFQWKPEMGEVGPVKQRFIGFVIETPG